MILLLRRSIRFVMSIREIDLILLDVIVDFWSIFERMIVVGYFWECI